MRKGGTIIFYSGSLKDSHNTVLPDESVRCPKGQNKDRFTLANRAFKVTDHNFFTTDLYADATPAADATTAQDPTRVTKRFGAGAIAKIDGVRTDAAMDFGRSEDAAQVNDIITFARIYDHDLVHADKLLAVIGPGHVHRLVTGGAADMADDERLGVVVGVNV